MKRWAQISDGVVINVVEQLDEPEMPGTWIECGSVGPGWRYDGTHFMAPVAQPVVVVVSRRQALRALLDAGLLESVTAAIDAMPEPARSRARIDWDNATEFRRDFPLLLALAASLGLSEADIDNLFAAAAAIT